MNARIVRTATVAATILSAALVAVACGGGGNGDGDGKGTIRIDGSSTVAPLSEAVAERFEEQSGVKVPVGTAGTGGGFEKFCNGEIDVNDASRQIKREETQACAKNGIKYHELRVANDGIAVVVNQENDWAQCLTTDQLKKIWDAGSSVDNWRDVDSTFPDEELTLYGPGTDSGTFDFFTDEINGEEGRSRTDYNATEDDNVTVQGVQGSKGGIGYFGLSYAEQNADKLKTVEVDGGSGCVAPSSETVQNGSYVPLSRPLFIYASEQLLARKEGKQFVTFYADNVGSLAKDALFVPLTTAQHDTLKQQVAGL